MKTILMFLMPWQNIQGMQKYFEQKIAKTTIAKKLPKLFCM